jgi:hypothetical protein
MAMKIKNRIIKTRRIVDMLGDYIHHPYLLGLIRPRLIS